MIQPQLGKSAVRAAATCMKAEPSADFSRRMRGDRRISSDHL